jgi:hypothetical protein
MSIRNYSLYLMAIHITKTVDSKTQSMMGLLCAALEVMRISS